MMMVFLFGILFIISMQPVFMVSSMIFITFFYSFFIFKEIGSYWFSYLLLLVMISGVLVLFTYMITLIPNESFEIYGLLLMFIMIFFMLLNSLYNYSLSSGMMTLSLWSSCLGLFSLFLISFLLIMMLLIVLLSSMNIGSLRVNYLCAW